MTELVRFLRARIRPLTPRSTGGLKQSAPTDWREHYTPGQIFSGLPVGENWEGGTEDPWGRRWHHDPNEGWRLSQSPVIRKSRIA